MPLLETLRDQVRALKKEVLEWRGKAHETELIMLEEHDKWMETEKLDKGTLRSKNVPSLGSNTGPNAVRRESEQLVAARLAMAKEVLKAVKRQLGAEIEKTKEAQRAAKMAADEAEAKCELRVSEMRELLTRARVSFAAAEEKMAEAEARAVEAEARAAAAEETMAEARPHAMRASSPPPEAGSEVPAVAERIVLWEPFCDPSSAC